MSTPLLFSYNKKNLQARGFTLVELLVATAVFIFVITLTTGALFSAQSLNVRLQQTQAIMDSLNLGVELMIRDARYGSNFYCTTTVQNIAGRRSCPHSASGSQSGSVLVLSPPVALRGSTNVLTDRVVYFVSGGVLYKNEYPTGTTARLNIQITPNDVNVSSISFFVTGAESVSEGDLNQPVITFSLRGVTIPAKQSERSVEFNIQTTVVPRSIDS